MASEQDLAELEHERAAKYLERAENAAAECMKFISDPTHPPSAALASAVVAAQLCKAACAESVEALRDTLFLLQSAPSSSVLAAAIQIVRRTAAAAVNSSDAALAASGAAITIALNRAGEES